MQLSCKNDLVTFWTILGNFLFQHLVTLIPSDLRPSWVIIFQRKSCFIQNAWVKLLVGRSRLLNSFLATKLLRSRVRLKVPPTSNEDVLLQYFNVTSLEVLTLLPIDDKIKWNFVGFGPGLLLGKEALTEESSTKTSILFRESCYDYTSPFSPLHS